MFIQYFYWLYSLCLFIIFTVFIHNIHYVYSLCLLTLFNMFIHYVYWLYSICLFTTFIPFNSLFYLFTLYLNPLENFVGMILPPGLKSLDFTGNFIRSVVRVNKNDEDCTPCYFSPIFYLKNLEALNFSKNFIDYIPEKFFAFNLYLENVDFSHNCLEFLPANLFFKNLRIKRYEIYL